MSTILLVILKDESSYYGNKDIYYDKRKVIRNIALPVFDHGCSKKTKKQN